MSTLLARLEQNASLVLYPYLFMSTDLKITVAINPMKLITALQSPKILYPMIADLTMQKMRRPMRVLKARNSPIYTITDGTAYSSCMRRPQPCGGSSELADSRSVMRFGQLTKT